MYMYMFQKILPFETSPFSCLCHYYSHMAVRICVLLSWFLASGLDYKALMSGEDALSVLQPVLLASNVHTVAKLANKIPSKVCNLTSFTSLL